MENEQAKLDSNIKDNALAAMGVRKPYTVFVCIMAIIVLGIFAFSSMQTDLFPSMNLPYAVVLVTPDTTYLGNLAQEDLAHFQTYVQDPTDADSKQHLLSLVGNDEGELAKLCQTLQVALMAGDVKGAVQTLMFLHMPAAEKLDTLAKAMLSNLSQVSGITNTQTSAITGVGTIMVMLEYSNDATVDTADLVVAMNRIKLDDTITYGIQYSQPMILKLDPSALPVMSVTVTYRGSDNRAEISDWLSKNVLSKVETTVGVGQVSSNIGQDNLSTDQAWEGVGDKFDTTFSISIMKNSNAVTTDVTAHVIETLEKIKISSGVKDGVVQFDYNVTSNQGDYINQSIGSVGENLIVGAILAIIILFMFLRSFKMTLAIGISIPLALVGTFVFMYFMGINLNIVSMAGLALAVGMLVDNSVVVLENIYRLRSKGLPIKDACIKGASQIMMAMLASSLTTICVFFPMFFLEGLMMTIFTDLVWVVILSLLCSFVVAVMFLPSIVATFKIEPRQPKAVSADKKPSWWTRFTAGAGRVFNRVLHFCIDKKWLTVALAFVIFVGSACLLLVNGFVLMPASDEGSFTVTVPLTEEGNNANHETLAKDLYEQIMQVLGKNSVAKCVVEYSSGQSTSAMLSGDMTPTLKVNVKLEEQRKISTDAASDKVYKLLNTNQYQPTGVVAEDKPVYQSDDVAVSASSMTATMVDSDVSVVVASSRDDLTAAIADLKQFGLDLDTKFAPLKAELKIKKVTGYENLGSQIIKYGNKNAITITVQALSDADTNRIQNKLNEFVDALLQKNDTLSVVDNGMQEQMNETYLSMGMALLVGFLLIYLVMVAIFQSFLMPFIILICVPLGFTGAFLALAMCGMPLSVPALIGFLILMGVVINNGILAVDYTNQARRDGLNVKDALVAAMRTRMRPIFMTALTTILAMVPMAFGWSLFNQGGNTALMQPLAVVSIGGLLFGTITTLLVVPAFYAIFCRDKKVKTVPASAQVAAPAAEQTMADVAAAEPAVAAPKQPVKTKAKRTKTAK